MCDGSDTVSRQSTLRFTCHFTSRFISAWSTHTVSYRPMPWHLSLHPYLPFTLAISSSQQHLPNYNIFHKQSIFYQFFSSSIKYLLQPNQTPPPSFKMRFSTILIIMAFMVISALASPVQSGNPIHAGKPGCLALDDATTIVGRYIAFLEHVPSDLGDANATAQLLLDDNYTEISDSFLSLKQSPVRSSPHLSPNPLTLLLP
jgi:hypothetical protein